MASSTPFAAGVAVEGFVTVARGGCEHVLAPNTRWRNRSYFETSGYDCGQAQGVRILGDGAEVEAQIEVGTLIVRGDSLRGNAVARQLSEIHAEGAVRGDITAPQIDIDKGSVFERKCTMVSPPEEPVSSSSSELTIE